MGPARAIVSAPRRRASSCMRSSAASRSARAAASAIFRSCVRACPALSFAAALLHKEDLRSLSAPAQTPSGTQQQLQSLPLAALVRLPRAHHGSPFTSAQENLQ